MKDPQRSWGLPLRRTVSSFLSRSRALFSTYRGKPREQHGKCEATIASAHGGIRKHHAVAQSIHLQRARQVVSHAIQKELHSQILDRTAHKDGAEVSGNGLLGGWKLSAIPCTPGMCSWNVVQTNAHRRLNLPAGGWLLSEARARWVVPSETPQQALRQHQQCAQQALSASTPSGKRNRGYQHPRALRRDSSLRGRRHLFLHVLRDVDFLNNGAFRPNELVGLPAHHIHNPLAV